MLSIEALETIITNCKTDKQIIKALENNNISFTDDTKEFNSFNVHLHNGMRIYKNTRKEYIVQNPFQKVIMKYSGIPTFFGSNSSF